MRRAGFWVGLLTAVILIVVPSSGAASIVSASWSADSLLTEIPHVYHVTPLYITIVDTSTIQAVSFDLQWCTLPGQEGFLLVAGSWWSAPDGNWLRAEEESPPESAFTNRTFADLPDWDGTRGFSGDTLRIVVPLRLIIPHVSNPSAWLRLSQVYLKTPAGIMSLPCPQSFIEVGPGEVECPPFVASVDPPLIVVDNLEEEKVFFAGVGLDSAVTMELVQPGYDTITAGAVTVESDSLAWGSVLLPDNAIGAWVPVLTDTRGRRVAAPPDVAAWDGVFQILDENGDTLDGATDIDVGNAAPGEVLLFARREALSYPDSLAQDSVLIESARGVTSPALFGLLEDIGAASIQRVFKRFTDDDLWTDSIDGARHRKPDLRNVFMVRVPEESDLEDVILKLRSHGDVLWAESNGLSGADVIPPPNDSFFCTEQWALCDSMGRVTIHAEAAWTKQVGQQGVKIGIVDSGIDYNHVDMGQGFGNPGDHVRDGWNYANNNGDPMDDLAGSHGTHVAGIAGALTNNGWGIAGVAGGWSGSGASAPELCALKVISGTGKWNSIDLAAAIRDAAAGPPGGFDVDVINVSLGDTDYCEIERAAIASAYVDQAVVVCSKGNDGNMTPHFPAGYDESWIIAVGASTYSGHRIPESSMGNNIDLVAPGEEIYSLLSTSSSPPFGYKSGTSMAAPHVAGAAALLLSELYDPHCQFLAPEDVQGLLTRSALDAGPTGYDSAYGYGILDVDTALVFLHAPWQFGHYSNWWNDNSSTYQCTKTYTFFGGGPLDDGPYKVKRYRVRTSITYDDEYVYPPYVWGRGSPDMIGWSAATPNYQVGYCRVVPGSDGLTGCDLETYVYDVWTIGGRHLGWYPAAPGDVEWEYTLLGLPTSCIGVGDSDGDSPKLPTPFLRLEPNPFNPTTVVHYRAPGTGPVVISVYDVSGRLVTTLVNRGPASSAGSITWNGLDSGGETVASGLYFFEMAVGADRVVRKGILIR